MDKIPSFLKDHDSLQPGFYRSGQSQDVVTFDLRFVRPNCGEFLSTASAHSIEHLLATVYRNSERGEDIVYFGPMGCRTGFYLLARNLSTDEARLLTVRCIRRALEMDAVPGAAKAECGNYLDHDLAAAKRDLTGYLAVISSPQA